MPQVIRRKRRASALVAKAKIQMTLSTSCPNLLMRTTIREKEEVRLLNRSFLILDEAMHSLTTPLLFKRQCL